MKALVALLMIMVCAGFAYAADTGMDVVEVGTMPGYVRDLYTTSVVDEDGHERLYRFWGGAPYVPALRNRSVTVTPTYENGEIVQVEIIPN